jgi:hypothetical protein
MTTVSDASGTTTLHGNRTPIGGYSYCAPPTRRLLRTSKRFAVSDDRGSIRPSGNRRWGISVWQQTKCAIDERDEIQQEDADRSDSGRGAGRGIRDIGGELRGRKPARDTPAGRAAAGPAGSGIDRSGRRTDAGQRLTGYDGRPPGTALAGPAISFGGSAFVGEQLSRLSRAPKSSESTLNHRLSHRI